MEETGRPSLTTVFETMWKTATNNGQGVIGRVFILFGLLVLTSGAVMAVPIPATEVISQTDISKWVFYDDETDKIDPTLGAFVTGPGTPFEGTGSVQISVSGSQRRDLATFQFGGVALADITAMSYSTYNPSAGNGGGASNAGFLNVGIDFDGPGGDEGFQSRLIYVPNVNGAVLQDTWQEWNTVDPGAMWSWSGGTFPGPNPAATKTWSQILLDYPNARINVGIPFVGIRVGNPDPSGYTENIDTFTFGTVSTGITIYDFDPTTSISVSPVTPGSENPFDNDYTRINNAIQAITSGGTITLAGTFDWSETNAANSWALGSNQQTGTGYDGDDYSILAPDGLDGVTVTANTLGDATIQGPGDLPVISLEGVFQFYAGVNPNWTISNLRFLDIDNPIGFYYVSGGVHAYDGTTVTNNYIRMPQDLNATAAPADDFQNIGLHYSFGDNILISGNTFDVPGDSVSDSGSGNFATNVVMQSNTSGGAYEGLQITNNIIRVLNAQSGDPERIIGIWENGHSHTKNITVSGNQFINLANGNDSSLNRQSAFRITSHSSLTSTAAYSNNFVDGANTGFEWLGPIGSSYTADFSAHEPVVLTSNTVLNGATGFLIQSQGKANMSFNRIAGNSVAGVNNIDGVVNADDNWWGCNYGPAAGGSGCVGSANGTTGTVSLTTWLTLTTSASSSSVPFGGSTAVTSALVINSAAADTSGSGNVLDGTLMEFSGTNGTVVPASIGTASGVGGTDFTGNAYGTGGVATTVDGQTVNAPIDVLPLCADISISDTTSLTGVQKVIPVVTSDLSTRNVVSADFTFTYDPAVMTPAATAATAGSVWASAAPTVTSNVVSPGTLNVSVFGSPPNPEAVGTGSLIDLHFDIGGVIGSTSGLVVSNVLYNGGLICTTAPTNGTLTVISGTVSGNVTYANAASPTVNVRGVQLSAPGTPLVTGITDANGDYSLSGFGPGSYTVTPSKARYGFGMSNPETGIFSDDATAIVQHVVGIQALNPTQLLAAKVSGSATATLSSFDAALVAQWIVGFDPTNPINHTGEWIFDPDSVNLGVVTANATQDYTAILLGDVNGSWSNLAGSLFEPRVLTEATKDSVNVSVPRMDAEAGSSISVPFRIDNLGDKAITSYQFDIEYDPAVLRADETGASLTGTNSEGLVVVSNESEPGLLKVVAYGVYPVSGDGVYVNLNFTVLGSEGETTPLAIKGFRFNDGRDQVFARSGELTVTAAETNVIRGRLVTTDGKPISEALITLMKGQKPAGSAVSGPGGGFEFSQLDTGETYTITAQSKRYRFTPVTVSLTNNVVEVEIIANQ